MQKLLALYFEGLPVEIHRLTGGATNTVFRVVCPEREEEVILRLFGLEGAWINRLQEHQLMQSLSSIRLVPRPLIIRPWGRLETYLAGSTLTPADCRPLISSIAQVTAQFHQHTSHLTPIEPEIFPLRVLQDWWSSRTKWITPESPAWVQAVLSWIPTEIKYLQSLDYKKGLCHNDLTPGNLIQTSKGLRLIDLEYGGLNFYSYDLANHLNEWRGLDLKLTPANPEECRQLCHHYLEAFDLSADQLDQRINQGVIEIQNLIPTSHLIWTLWGISQAQISQLDFDYLEYAHQRSQMFEESRTQRLP